MTLLMRVCAATTPSKPLADIETQPSGAAGLCSMSVPGRAAPRAARMAHSDAGALGPAGGAEHRDRARSRASPRACVEDVTREGVESSVKSMTGSAGEAQEGDEAIVARVLAGDRNAYVGLVVRHQDLLYRHALRMTGEADAAADLVQVAFVKAYTQLARCREPHRFGAWAF